MVAEALEATNTATLAPIAAASFCVAKRNKRYSGKREIALKNK